MASFEQTAKKIRKYNFDFTRKMRTSELHPNLHVLKKKKNVCDNQKVYSPQKMSFAFNIWWHKFYRKYPNS